MAILAVIPAFNEARTIGRLVEQTRACVDEVIVVDDGSSDDTATQADTAGARVIRHSANRGKAGALITGFSAALQTQAELVITLDGDGQHRPEDIGALIEIGGDGACLAIGARTVGRGNVPRLRRFGNWTADFWISLAAGRRITDSQSGFRLYPRALLETIDPDVPRARGFAFEADMLIEAAWRGFEIRSVPIPALYEADMRPSHYRPAADTWVIIRTVARRILRRWFRGTSP